MRMAGVIENTAAEIEWWQYMEIIRECEARRAAWERHFSPPESACPFGCDGRGWREVYEDEDQEPHFLEVIYDGRLYTWCQCNGQLVLVDGHYEPRPVRPFQAN